MSGRVAVAWALSALLAWPCASAIGGPPLSVNIGIGGPGYRPYYPRPYYGGYYHPRPALGFYVGPGYVPPPAYVYGPPVVYVAPPVAYAQPPIDYQPQPSYRASPTPAPAYAQPYRAPTPAPSYPLPQTVPTSP